MTIQQEADRILARSDNETDELLARLAQDRDALLAALKGIWDRMDELVAVQREGVTGAAYSAVTASFNVDITDEFNAAERAIAQAEAHQ